MNAQAPIRRPGRKWLIGTGVAVLIFLAYLWAGYVLAPRLIRSEATRWAGRHANLSLGLGPIKVNPFRFTISIRNIRLAEPSGTLLALGRLYLGVSPLSLLGHGYHITALYLNHPSVHVVIGPEGEVNLAALFVSSGQSGGPSPTFRIDDLRVNQGEVSLTDLGRSPAAHAMLAPITFRLTNFSTQGRSDGQFFLQAQIGAANLAWQGHVSMSPAASRGAVSLSGLDAGALAKFLPPELPMTPSAGQMSVSAQYDVAYGARGLVIDLSAVDFAATGLDLHGKTLPDTVRIARIEADSGTLHVASAASAEGSLPVLTLSGVRLSARPAGGQSLRLARLTLKGTTLAERQHRIAVSSLAVAGLNLPVRRSKNGRLSLLRFLSAPAPRGASSASGAARSGGAAWQIRLGHLAVTDAEVPVEDLAVSPAARFAVTLHSFTAASLSNDLARAVPFSVRASIDRAYLALDGRVTPASRSAALWLSLAHLSLKTFAPYLPLAPSAQLRSGQLGARAFAQITAGNLARFDGRASVAHVQLLERANGAGLFGWQDLRLSGIQYRTDHLVIDQARLSAPVGDITILPNRTLNLAALMPARSAPSRTPPAGRHPRATTAAFSAVLKRFEIEDGAIVFADQSIEPHFRAPVDDLRGTIMSLSTAHGSIATIRLSGQVIDRFSPVSVRGELNPYGLGRDTDIHVAFNDIQLPIFNPYSDFYAGYAIAKGTLSTRFHYRIVNRRLQADHLITIDQLQWGGPSGSKHRVGWPIRFATALLKDRRGVIRIDLPVTGSLDNPDFHIASIVWMMLRHLLEKAALAPFELIGKLFAGAQKAQYIDFMPGSAALPPGAAGSLAALAHALSQRPAVQVDIPAGPAGPQDALALEDARINALLAARSGARGKAGVRPLSLSAQLRELASLYRTRLKRRPVYPAPPTVASAASAAGSHGAVDEKVRIERARVRWLRNALRPTVRPSSETLATLGLTRARHLQDALLAHGILKANRVFLTSGASGTAWHGRIRLKLRLR